MKSIDFAQPDPPVYTIGDAARTLGISINLLRFYESEGLILPARTPANQRRYSRKDLERIRCIRLAIQNDGMTISAIRRIMAMIPCWQIRRCSEEDRNRCEAFRGSSQPCWSYEHENNTCKELDCRNCSVYQLTSDCHTIKAAIINSTQEP